MKYKQPTDDGLNKMLSMIVGDDSSAKSLDGLNEDDMSHHGMFVNSDGELVASCACDLPTAAALGCALSMIPPGGAEGMVEDGELTAMASSNFYEVMNILSSLFMSDSTPHLKLKRVDQGDAEAIASDDIGNSGFTLDLGKYGSGKLLFRSV